MKKEEYDQLVGLVDEIMKEVKCKYEIKQNWTDEQDVFTCPVITVKLTQNTKSKFPKNMYGGMWINFPQNEKGDIGGTVTIQSQGLLKDIYATLDLCEPNAVDNFIRTAKKIVIQIKNSRY